MVCKDATWSVSFAIYATDMGDWGTTNRLNNQQDWGTQGSAMPRLRVQTLGKFNQNASQKESVGQEYLEMVFREFER